MCTYSTLSWSSARSSCGQACYESWAQRKASCPTCRAPVWAITRDAEFAKLIGAQCTLSSDKTDCGFGPKEKATDGTTRIIKVPAPAGLTIANSGAGCVITKVIRGNGGYLGGLRTGDIIVAVNGTEVRDHKHCVEFIEKRCRVGDCELEIKPRGTAVLGHNATVLLRGLAASPLHALSRGRRSDSPGGASRSHGRLFSSGNHSGSESESDESPDGRGSPMAVTRSPGNSPLRERGGGARGIGRRSAIGPSPLGRAPSASPA